MLKYFWPRSETSSCFRSSLAERDVTGNFQWGRKSTSRSTETNSVSPAGLDLHRFIPSDSNYFLFMTCDDAVASRHDVLLLDEVVNGPTGSARTWRNDAHKSTEVKRVEFMLRIRLLT